MAITEKIHQIDPRLLEDLIDLRDTREETLRELGQQEGLIRAIKAFAKKHFPKINESSFAPLEQCNTDELQEIHLALLDVTNIKALRSLLEGQEHTPKSKKR